MTIASARRAPRAPLALACALALLALLPAARARADRAPTRAAAALGAERETSAPLASASLEACVTAAAQSERSATFAGEMSAVPGTARMEISIQLLEHASGEARYRLVSAPGLGAWRSSAAGVKVYTYIKQVTNLAAGAFYRAVVRFRWLGDRGRQIKAEALRTPRCEQPPAPSASVLAPGASP